MLSPLDLSVYRQVESMRGCSFGYIRACLSEAEDPAYREDVNGLHTSLSFLVGRKVIVPVSVGNDLHYYAVRNNQVGRNY